MSYDRERSGLRPWHVILGILGLLILAVVLWVFIQANNANSQLQALRDRGQPTSYAEWTQEHQVPPGIENAAEIYMMATRAFVKPADDANTPYVGREKLPVGGEPLSKVAVQVTEQFLADNAQTLALLRQAAAIERSYYDSGAPQNLPPLADLRGCVRLLAAAAVLRAQQGDTVATVAYIDDATHAAQSLRNQPTLVSYLVRLACLGTCIDVLQWSFGAAEFTDEQLVQIDRMLSEAASSLDLAKAFAGERCGSIEMFNNPSLVEGGRVMKVPGIRSVGLTDILDYMASCIEACELPPVERIDRLGQLGDELGQLSGLHIIAKILAPPLRRVAEIDLRGAIELDMARIAVAIERYRLVTGRVPESLAVLVPDYLDQVPVDPYDGQPMCYRVTETGYRLYSIGSDRKDNGGQGKEEVDRDAPYDLPFVVVRQ